MQYKHSGVVVQKHRSPHQFLVKAIITRRTRYNVRRRDQLDDYGFTYDTIAQARRMIGIKS